MKRSTWIILGVIALSVGLYVAYKNRAEKKAEVAQQAVEAA